MEMGTLIVVVVVVVVIVVIVIVIVIIIVVVIVIVIVVIIFVVVVIAVVFFIISRCTFAIIVDFIAPRAVAIIVVIVVVIVIIVIVVVRRAVAIIVVSQPKCLVMHQCCVTQWMAKNTVLVSIWGLPMWKRGGRRKKYHLGTPRFHTVFETIWRLTDTDQKIEVLSNQQKIMRTQPQSTKMIMQPRKSKFGIRDG